MIRSLIINQGDSGGGAAVAAMTLHRALKGVGVDSHVAVDVRTLVDDPKIHQLARGQRTVDRVFNSVSRRLGLDGISGTGAFAIRKQMYFKDADIINLHLLHGGYFNYLAVKGMASDKPVVMTLHDMWHFTGHCVYSFDCERWKTGCGNCPYPEIYASVQRDATAFNVRRKKAVFVRPNVHLVAISAWMERQLRQSLLSELPIHRIPNGVDTDVYRPVNRDEARASLGVPSGKKVILYCAANVSDRRKGADLLIGALERIAEATRSDYFVLIMGDAAAEVTAALPLESKSLGFVGDPQTKVLVYNAADVFAFPTRADNLPVVLQEALGCGTPAVSFDVGGVSDVVRHRKTGLLAEAGNVNEFAHSLSELLGDEALRLALSRQGREIASNEFSTERQGKSYAALYESILGAK